MNATITTKTSYFYGEAAKNHASFWLNTFIVANSIHRGSWSDTLMKLLSINEKHLPLVVQFDDNVVMIIYNAKTREQ